MAQTREINGIAFTRIRNPQGRGFVYFADGGPGGQVQAYDSGMIDQGTMNALTHWDSEPYKDDEPKTPKQQFNMGWR